MIFSLIIPTYNECKTINDLIKSLSLLLDEIYGQDYEVIVVDDNSPDGTAEIVEGMQSAYSKLRLIKRSERNGLADSILFGFKNAKGDILGVIDADFQHPVEVLPKMISKAKEGFDLVVATRFSDGGSVDEWSKVRKLISMFAHKTGEIIVPGIFRKTTDPLSGYFVVNKKVFDENVFDPIGFKILINFLEIIGKERIAEVGYQMQPRKLGIGKLNFCICLQYLKQLLKMRFKLCQSM